MTSAPTWLLVLASQATAAVAIGSANGGGAMPLWATVAIVLTPVLFVVMMFVAYRGQVRAAAVVAEAQAAAAEKVAAAQVTAAEKVAQGMEKVNDAAERTMKAAESTALDIGKVHTAVNSERTAMLETVKGLRDEILALTKEAATLRERDRQVQQQQQQQQQPGPHPAPFADPSPEPTRTS